MLQALLERRSTVGTHEPLKSRSSSTNIQSNRKCKKEAMHSFCSAKVTRTWRMREDGTNARDSSLFLKSRSPLKRSFSTGKGDIIMEGVKVVVWGPAINSNLRLALHKDWAMSLTMSLGHVPFVAAQGKASGKDGLTFKRLHSYNWSF